MITPYLKIHNIAKLSILQNLNITPFSGAGNFNIACSISTCKRETPCARKVPTAMQDYIICLYPGKRLFKSLVKASEPLMQSDVG